MGFPSKEESMKATKRDILTRKLLNIWQRLYDFNIIIVDDIKIPMPIDMYDSFDPYDLTRKFPSDRFYKPYVNDLMAAKVCDFGLDYGSEEFFSVEERPNSLFQFKTKHMVYDRRKPEVFETYYSVIHLNHIDKLIREGSDMKKQGGINPLLESDQSATNVYVLSRQVGYSGGFCDLVDMKRNSRNRKIELYFVIDEASVEKIIELDERTKKHRKERMELEAKVEKEGYMYIDYHLLDFLCRFRTKDDLQDWDKSLEYLEKIGFRRRKNEQV